MIRGLYTSCWSMLANSKQMDVISNNLANADTNAFKRDNTVFEAFPSVLTKRINDTRSNINPSGNIGSMQLSSDIGEVFTYYTQGQLLNSGRSLDLSIKDNTADQNSKTKPEAFFTLAVPGADGKLTEYYTRDGAFTLNSSKQLVNKDGYLVMGENGPIVLKDENFQVNSDGTIYQNGKELDKLKIVSFADTTTLRKFGSNLAQRTNTSVEEAFSGEVVQGSLEQSNVNIVKEMVNMITVTRAYEANQKVLQAQDGTLDKAVNQIGSVR